MPLRILHLEDHPLDAEPVETLLVAEGLEPNITRATSGEEFLGFLKPGQFDLILSAYLTRGFDGLTALSAVRKTLPRVPFIFVSGEMGEEVAIDCLRRGATDYVLKSRLGKLGPCVRRALHEMEETKVRLRAEAEKEEALRQTTEALRESEDRFRIANEDLEQRVAERTWELVYANRELRNQMTERERLERSVLQIAEHERRTLGQDLHDGLCQHLTGVACMTKALSERLRNKGLEAEGAELAEVTGWLSDAANQTRFIARGLHPVELDAEGLLSALSELAAQTSRRIPCQLRCAEPVEVSNNSVALNLYRVAQEALNNSVKHSRAKSIVIHLNASNGCLRLEVSDDGCGLPAAERLSSGMGIRLMNYRAGVIGGAFSIRPGLQGGTRVTCVVPLDGSGLFAREA